MADVLDPQAKKRTAATAALSQIPTDGYPTVTGGTPVDGSELGRNVSNTISALSGVAPVLGAVKTLSLATRTGQVAPMAATGAASTVAPYAVPGAGFAALASAASPPPAPAVPSASALPNAPAPTVAAPAAAPAATGGATTALSTVPAPAGGGTITFNPATNEYSGRDIGPGATIVGGRSGGAITDQNMRAAQALSDLGQQQNALKFQYDREVADAAAGNRFTLGLLQQQRDQADRAALVKTATTDQSRSRARNALDALTSGAQLQQRATEAAATQELEGQRVDLARRRLGVDALTAGADVALKTSQAAVAQRLNAAQARLQGAKTDAEREAAVEELRALQGKYEKDVPELFATTALPPTTDALGNRTPGGAIVTNKRDGSVKIIYGSELQQGNPQPLPPKDKLVKGQVYQTQRGPAKWDGTQFIPA